MEPLSPLSPSYILTHFGDELFESIPQREHHYNGRADDLVKEINRSSSFYTSKFPKHYISKLSHPCFKRKHHKRIFKQK